MTPISAVRSGALAAALPWIIGIKLVALALAAVACLGTAGVAVWRRNHGLPV